MKKILLSAALLMGLSTAVFAGTPKGEAKEPKKAEVSSNTSTNLVWYKVTYDAAHPSGYIPAGRAPEITADKAEAEELNLCPDGASYDCLRGFENPPTLPTNSAGSDQVKTNQQPS